MAPLHDPALWKCAKLAKLLFLLLVRYIIVYNSTNLFLQCSGVVLYIFIYYPSLADTEIFFE